MTGIVVGQQPRSIGRLGLVQPAGLQHNDVLADFHPSTSGNRGSGRSFRGGTARQCCPRRAAGRPDIHDTDLLLRPKTAAGRRISFTRVSRLPTRNRGAWRDSHGGRLAEEERAAIVKHDGGIPRA